MYATKLIRRRAFTLIELMVAVAIIGLLVGILIPTFNAVTSAAKSTASTATFSVLERGLESYRGEPALGGVYPPSRSDDPNNAATSPLHIRDPLSPNGAHLIGISGANLLAYGLVGADQYGTPGFRDLNNNGHWWDDLRSDNGSNGAYEIDTDTREPLHPRYPSTGGSFVDEATKNSLSTIFELQDQGVLVERHGNPMGAVEDQIFFTDAWQRPILYYRATRGAAQMVTNPGAFIGSYDIRDNAYFTGNSFFVTQFKGIDWGAGVADTDNDLYSQMGHTLITLANDPNPNLQNGVHEIDWNPGFANTFERFILDRSVTRRNQAVNADSYLLISAGADAIYGTGDDITNWTRENQ